VSLVHLHPVAADGAVAHRASLQVLMAKSLVTGHQTTPLINLEASVTTVLPFDLTFVAIAKMPRRASAASL
jgi:hypothetical protein